MDYISASEVFIFTPSTISTQVCMPILTLEDELVEDVETVSIAAIGTTGIVVSGSPVSLEIHSRECMYQGLTCPLSLFMFGIQNFLEDWLRLSAILSYPPCSFTIPVCGIFIRCSGKCQFHSADSGISSY